VTPFSTTESVFTDDGQDNEAEGYGEGSKKRAWWERDAAGAAVFAHETTNARKGFTSTVTRALENDDARMKVVMTTRKHDASREAHATRYFDRVASSSK